MADDVCEVVVGELFYEVGGQEYSRSDEAEEHGRGQVLDGDDGDDGSYVHFVFAVFKDVQYLAIG